MIRKQYHVDAAYMCIAYCVSDIQGLLLSCSCRLQMRETTIFSTAC